MAAAKWILLVVVLGGTFLAGLGVGVYVVGDAPLQAGSANDTGVGGESDEATPIADETSTPTPVSTATSTPETTPTASGGRTATATPRPPVDRRLSELNATLIEVLIHRRVNELRVERSLRRLERQHAVAAFSRSHSHEMATHEYVGTYGPDGTSRETLIRRSNVSERCQFISNNGNFYHQGAVNVAFLDRTSSTVRINEEPGIASAVVRRWMGGGRDRRNLLLENADSDGVGVVVDEDSGIYVTHTFC